MHLPPGASDTLRHLAGAALAGGAICRAALARVRVGDMVKKAARDHQTETSVAAERAIVAALAPQISGWSVTGEEGADDCAGSGPRRIVIDPIDGTTNFAWGISHFGLTVAVAEGDRVLAGIVFDAMAGEMFAAAEGRGPG